MSPFSHRAVSARDRPRSLTKFLNTASCPDASRCTRTGNEETFSEIFAVEVRRGRWGYLKESRFSTRCQTAGSTRKSWSVPGSPPSLF